MILNFSNGNRVDVDTLSNNSAVLNVDSSRLMSKSALKDRIGKSLSIDILPVLKDKDS